VTLQRPRLAAVLFADIVGFTRLTAENDAGAYRLAAELQAQARVHVGAAGGRVVRFVGDAVLAEFPSAAAAVDCALALDVAFAERSQSIGLAAALHTGIHLGELTQAPDGDIYGDSVNIAARIQAEAGAGQVLVSDTVWRQLRGRHTFVFEPAGTRQLKGLAETVTLYAAHAAHAARAADTQAPAALSPDTPLPAATSPDTPLPAATSPDTPLPGAGAPPAIRSEAESSEPAPPARSGASDGGAQCLIVLPFRMLRPDAEIDFLSFSLADAITASLSGLRSLVVRSSLTAQRLGDAADPRSIGRDADVDLVLSGTVLRGGDRLRVTAQLADTRSGTVLWTEAQQVPLGDLFQLQDELAQRIVGSLATPLTAREQRMIRRDVPATAKAYEYYLRANQLAHQAADWSLARELYLQALAEDGEYAPAWARLGRCYRLIAKHSLDAGEVRSSGAAAEDAFRRALALNPDLSLAHNLYAQLEVERGRAREAMVRLLARLRLAPHAELFAGLAHALRYCGLLDESLAAHHAARRLDLNVHSSGEYTYLLLQRYDDALRESERSPALLRGWVRLAAGDEHAGLALVREAVRLEAGRRGIISAYCDLADAFVRRDVPAMRAALPALETFPDPEGHYGVAYLLIRGGAVADAVPVLDRIVDGFACEHSLRYDPQLEPLRAHPAFADLLARATAARERARSAFLQSNGPELLELPVTSAGMHS
jgi:class 3 adenylate cyclase/TolB-like protein